MGLAPGVDLLHATLSSDLAEIFPVERFMKREHVMSAVTEKRDRVRPLRRRSVYEVSPPPRVWTAEEFSQIQSAKLNPTGDPAVARELGAARAARKSTKLVTAVRPDPRI
jgi:hypothetical protein